MCFFDGLTRDELEQVVSSSDSVASVIRNFGLSTSSGNYRTLVRHLSERGIDFSHLHEFNKNKGGKVKKKELEEILVCNSSYTNRGYLKVRLLRDGLLKNACYECGLKPEWNGKELIFVLDHVNGTSNDHRLENLRLLCPNCNSQTSTFCGRRNRIKWCCKVCSKEITRFSKHKMCASCAMIGKRRKVERPTLQELYKLTNEIGFCATGRIYGVSDNAVRKWIRVAEKKVI